MTSSQREADAGGPVFDEDARRVHVGGRREVAAEDVPNDAERGSTKLVERSKKGVSALFGAKALLAPGSVFLLVRCVPARVPLEPACH